MKVSDIGEFGLIDRIKEEFAGTDGVLGIGDDCALLPQKDGLDTLVSTDMLVEGTHFLKDDVSPWQLGWKSAAVNISDIAAMGGIPSSTFLSLAIPPSTEVVWMDAFVDGFKSCCLQYGAPLLGGDTTSSGSLICINVTVLGTCPSGCEILRRGAREGDLVCVTGPLGDSAGGLRVILDKLQRTKSASLLVERHYMPRPKVQEGQILRDTPGVHSMMDISDGVASDLLHILSFSGLGARLDLESLPLSDELKEVFPEDAAAMAAGGGEDYQLLFTCSPTAAINIPYYVIGSLFSSDDHSIIWDNAEERKLQGFRHF